jgi:hypothetical protein
LAGATACAVERHAGERGEARDLSVGRTVNTRAFVHECCL